MKLQLVQLLLEAKGLILKHFLCSHTYARWENTNTDIYSASLIVPILSDRQENIIILKLCSWLTCYSCLINEILIEMRNFRAVSWVRRLLEEDRGLCNMSNTVHSLIVILSTLWRCFATLFVAPSLARKTSVAGVELWWNHLDTFLTNWCQTFNKPVQL